MTEVEFKLAAVRAAMGEAGLAAVRLRGVDWFAWATAGGDSSVLGTVEAGVAEVLVTDGDAYVLTDAIEAPRMRDEVAPPELAVWEAPWQRPEAREAFVRDAAGGGPVASDRTEGDERPLPDAVVEGKRRLRSEEVDRYARLGRDAAEAMTEALTDARPEWTEHGLAGRLAAALRARGVYPALILVGGEGRVGRYRHPVPTGERLGGRAMLVACARRHGLVASLTRWVYFREPTPGERALDAAVREVEAAALWAAQPPRPLSRVYRALADAYAAVGHPDEIDRHHQGGTTGYLAREVIASPTTETEIQYLSAIALNPSLPGAKIEDTVLCGLEQSYPLTFDPAWPSVPAPGPYGIPRPDLLIRP